MAEQSYVLNGPVSFVFPYPVRLADQLTLETSPNGSVVPPGEYSVYGAGPNATQVTVEWLTAPDDGTKNLTISRYIEPDRVSDFSDTGIDGLEAEFDNIYQVATDQEDRQDRALERPLGSANFDAEDRVIENVDTPTADDHAVNKGYADTVSDTAQGFANDAEQSATDAETAQGLSEDARDASQAARDAAQAARDTASELVNERYLGTFDEDPTTDNNGDPLEPGVLYFNSGNGQTYPEGFRYYTDEGDWDSFPPNVDADQVNYENGLTAQQAFPAIPLDNVKALVDATHLQIDGLQAQLRAFYSNTDTGGGPIYFDENRDKADANGGTIIDPANVGTLSDTALGTFLSQQGTGSGTGCWVRLFDGMINTAWYGSLGDNTTDSTESVQAAINTAIYEEDRGGVYIPSGLYVFSDTVHLGYGVSGFKGIHLFSDSARNGHNDNSRGASIRVTHNDRPGIAIQGGRKVQITNVRVIGVNRDHVVLNGLGGNSPEFIDTDVSAWLGSELASTSDSRYAPYAGIAIDPYSGPEPSTPYPDVNYPDFLGDVDQYNKSFTSRVFLDNVSCEGFVVGLAIKPSDQGSQADWIAGQGCEFAHNVYNVSVGHSNARGLNFWNTEFDICHTCLTNIKHGKQTGTLSGALVGCVFGRSIQVFDISSIQAQPLSIVSCRGELLWRLGDFGTGRYTVSFYDFVCLQRSYVPVRGICADWASGTAPLKFYGGYIAYHKGLAASSPVIFEGTTLETTLDSDGLDSGLEEAKNLIIDWCEVFVTDIGSPREAREGSILFNDHSQVSRKFVDQTVKSFGRENVIPRISRKISRSGVRSLPIEDEPTFGNQIVSYGPKSGTTVSLSGITGTVDLGNLHNRLGVEPGDILIDDDSNTIFAITGVSGTTVDVEALNNFNGDTGSETLTVPVDTGDGSWRLCITRFYTTTNPLFGDFTSGSSTITNIGDYSGDFGGSTSSELAVGDELFVEEALENPVDRGAKITAIDSGNREITLDTNANESLTKKRLKLWVRH